MMVSLGRRALLSCSATAFFASAAGSAASSIQRRPELFFYPPAVRLADNSVLASPITIDGTQIAEGFPQIKEMSGVVLALYWFQIEPSPGNYNFSIVEHALSFWGKIDKKVVLDIATVGYPIYWVENGESVFRTPTPPEVLREVQTYEQQVRVIAPLHQMSSWNKRSTLLPSYFDPQFATAVEKMVRALSQFDGHPGLSKVRIATGIGSEDNPAFDGLKSSMPGWSNQAWLAYCKQMTEVYLSNFRRTQLEFDLDRIGWIYALGTAMDRMAADAFIQYLGSKYIFLAVDGLETANIAAWRLHQPTSGVARDIQYLQQQHAAGRAIGLEAGRAFSNPLFNNVDVIAAAIRDIGADRLVLFADAPATLNFQRLGLNAQNETTVRAMAPTAAQDIANRTRRLLTLIGYGDA